MTGILPDGTAITDGTAAITESIEAKADMKAEIEKLNIFLRFGV
jgi:hypothetical protein